MTQGSIRYEYSSNYNPQPKDKNKKSDSLYINKTINGWDVTFSVTEEGKVSLSAYKQLGTIAKAATAGDNEASINLTVETTVNRVPAFQLIDSNTRFNPQFVELDNRENKTTESFKDSEFHRREYPASSILTTEEFISEIIPSFEALLKDTKLNGHIAKISNEAAKVQPPHNKEYRRTK